MRWAVASSIISSATARHRRGNGGRPDCISVDVDLQRVATPSTQGQRCFASVCSKRYMNADDSALMLLFHPDSARPERRAITIGVHIGQLTQQSNAQAACWTRRMVSAKTSSVLQWNAPEQTRLGLSQTISQ